MVFPNWPTLDWSRHSMPPFRLSAPPGICRRKVLYETSAGRDRQNFPELPTDWEGFADQEGILELNAVVLKACHHDPRQRYQSAREMHADLALLNSGKSVRRLRLIEHRLNIATKVSAVAGVVAVVALAAFLGSLQQSRRADRIA